MSQEQPKSESVLLIDSFSLDPWVNSRTGDTGKSPHGSCEEFEIDCNGRILDSDHEIPDDDGNTTYSLTRSITFYGG
ncbi:hypothetical protein RRSWK_04713 [Rhodopirellula sp. SWK7]|nr:hypothetical protein RRSWK_04713 [Rhodopirellula sp. SWK7]